MRFIYLPTLLPAYIGLCVTLGACAATPPAANADEAPLAIQLDVNDPQRLGISVSFDGEAAGETRLRLDPDFGFTEPQADWFANFTASCIAADCSARLDPETMRVLVTHIPGDRVTLSYDLPLRPEGPSDVGRYEPLIHPDGVSIYTGITVFTPERHTARARHGAADVLNVSIAWTGLDARGWQGFSPLGPGSGPEPGALAPMRFGESLLTAGPGSVIHTLGNGARLGVIPMPGGRPEPEHFMRLVEPAIAEIQALFAERAPAGSWYFISYGAAGPEEENAFALGGTAVTNAFGFYHSPGLDIGDNPDIDVYVQDVVAHEYFHNWNGVLFYLRDGTSDHATRWFVEGFTQYYARIMPWRADLYDDDLFLSRLNDAVLRYQSYPPARLSEAELRALWEVDDPDAEGSYVRGEIIALILDEAIQVETDGRHSLDDLMLFLAEGAASGTIPDPGSQTVYDWISRTVGTDLADRVRRYVTDGGEMPLPLHIRTHNLERYQREDGLFAYRPQTP